MACKERMYHKEWAIVPKRDDKCSFKTDNIYDSKAIADVLNTEIDIGGIERSVRRGGARPTTYYIVLTNVTIAMTINIDTIVYNS